MKEPKFILKQTKNEDEETLIFLYNRIGKHRLRYSVGEKVKPKHWSSANERAKSTAPRQQAINHQITIIKRVYKQELKDLMNEGVEITAQELKQRMEIRFGRKEYEQDTPRYSMFDYFRMFHKKIKTERGYDSAKMYLQALKHLERFNPSMDWEDLNMQTYHGLVEYFNKKNMALNTIGSHLKRIKTMARRAKAEGHTEVVVPDGWKYMSESAEAIALTDDEVNLVYDLNLEDDKYLDKVRDLFVLGCRTGLRSGNFLKINPETDVIGGMLRVSAIKGGGVVNIPLHWQVKEILNKYDGNLPSMTNQYFNRRIKEVAVKAGLKTTVKRQITKGGKKTTEVNTKWEKISSHTARRSFATQMYLLGFKPAEIMSITGHKSLGEFMKYIRIDREQNAQKMSQHPFFHKCSPNIEVEEELSYCI